MNIVSPMLPTVPATIPLSRIDTNIVNPGSAPAEAEPSLTQGGAGGRDVAEDRASSTQSVNLTGRSAELSGGLNEQEQQKVQELAARDRAVAAEATALEQQARSQFLLTVVLSVVLFGVLFWPPVSAMAQVERVVDGNRTSEGLPVISEAALARAGQFANIRSAYALDWHPSGQSILIRTRFGDTSQLHVVNEPMGTRRQLTFFDEPVTGGAFAPTKTMNSVMFGRDAGGNENWQLFVHDINNGLVSPITPEGSRSQSGLWSKSGSHVAYASNRDDAKRFDVWVTPSKDPDLAKMLVKGTGFYWNPAAWSPDGKQLIVMQVVSKVDSRPHLVNVASGAIQRLGPTDRKVAFGEVVFKLDGTSIYTTSDEGSEFRQLVLIDLASGETRVITRDIPWDIESLSLSADGQELAFTANERGVSQLYLLSTSNNKYRPMAAVPKGVITGLKFAPRGSMLALTLNRATSAADVYVLDTKSDELTRWTQSESGGLNPDRFVDAELIEFPTFDKVDSKPRMIPAFLYRPNEGTPSKLPVVISIHGGPEGQSRQGFSARTQQLVEALGAVVIVPNVRGSSGYGKTYLDLDNGMRREDSVKDIGALLEWIATQPRLDAQRVAVIGGSYGGYMVLASMTYYNDRLKAGVEYFGVSNFVTFLQNTSDYRRDHRRQEYGDERDPAIFEYLNRTAPMNNVQQISRPLFVLQGANDPRVPTSESEQIVEKVRSNGGEVWYLLFDDEGHGFRKKANLIFSDAGVMSFLKKYL